MSDALLQQAVDRLDAQSPFARYAIVDVTFAAADRDTPIAHEFVGVDPDSIRWIPLNIEGKAYVYRPLGTQKAWTSETIWLHASDACRVRLLLAVEHP